MNLFLIPIIIGIKEGRMEGRGEKEEGIKRKIRRQEGGRKTEGKREKGRSNK
jgi:hypothetical protein